MAKTEDRPAAGADQSPEGPTVQQRIEELRTRGEEALAPAGEAAVKAQHERGKLTARERIDQLVDRDSFTELDRFAKHRSHDFGMENRRPDGDGVVTGFGTIGGRKVFLARPGLQGVRRLARRGARPEDREGPGSRALHRRADDPDQRRRRRQDPGGRRLARRLRPIFDRNVRASGVVPQISLIMGPCAGGAVYSPAITDFIFMVRETSHMFITGPEVIKTVTGEDVTFEELGGAMTHASRSGVASFVANDEESCLAEVRYLLSFLPQNNLEDPPTYAPTDDPERRDEPLNHIIPDSSRAPYDMHEVIRILVDEGEFLEVFPLWAMNIVIGFARLDGRTVGIVANQPKVLAGTLDIESSEKASRFVRFCDAFNVPLLALVDVPGFLPGADQEYQGIIRHGAKLLYAFAEATVPRATVITRKAYGGAYLVMNSKHLRGDSRSPGRPPRSP